MAGQTNMDVWRDLVDKQNSSLPPDERVANPFCTDRSAPSRHPARSSGRASNTTAKDYPGDLLLIMETDGIKGFIKEHKFNPERRWRLDLAHLDLKIGIECHGGVWTNGRHTRGKGFTNDREKMNDALARGWQILEFTSDQIKSGAALAMIEEVFIKRILEFANG